MKKYWLEMTNTFCQGNIVGGWLGHEDGSITPCVCNSAKEAAKSMLEDRIAWLESRLENIDAMDDEDEDEDFFIEAADDIEIFFEPVTITGKDGDAVVRFLNADNHTATLAELAVNSGHLPDTPIRWPMPGETA